MSCIRCHENMNKKYLVAFLIFVCATIGFILGFIVCWGYLYAYDIGFSGNDILIFYIITSTLIIGSIVSSIISIILLVQLIRTRNDY